MGVGTVSLWKVVLERRLWLVLVAWCSVIRPLLEPGPGWLLRMEEWQHWVGGSRAVRKVSTLVGTRRLGWFSSVWAEWDWWVAECKCVECLSKHGVPGRCGFRCFQWVRRSTPTVWLCGPGTAWKRQLYSGTSTGRGESYELLVYKSSSCRESPVLVEFQCTILSVPAIDPTEWKFNRKQRGGYSGRNRLRLAEIWRSGLSE